MPEIAESIHCPNCGAPLELKPGEVIITCGFCGSDHNMAVGKKFFLKHSIIPSRIPPAQVEGLARNWMRGGFLKPQDLAKRAVIRSAEMTFLPFFVVHLYATSRYEGLFTRTGQNIPKKGDMTREYYWKVLGRRASSFPTQEYEIPLAGKVEFNLGHVPEGAKFLNAEMDEGEARQKVRMEVDGHHKFLLENEVDIVQSMETDVDVKDVEFVHAPVWTIVYEYGGRTYQLLLDGASGKDIRGDIPEQAKKKGLFGGLLGG